MAEIRWTEEAQLWLQDIHNYIAQDKPDAANKLVESIYELVSYRMLLLPRLSGT